MNNYNNFQEPIDEKQVGFSQVVLKWGLISGGVGIGIQLLTYIVGLDKLGGLFSLLSVAVSLVLLYLAVKEHRDEQLGGLMSFGRGFIVCLLVMTISGFFGAVFNYIYLNFVSPETIDLIVSTTEQTLGKIFPEDQLEAMLEQTDKSLRSPLSILNGVIGTVVLGSILAAIYGAVMQKKKPLF